MTSASNPSLPSKKEYSSIPIFEAWKEYEKVAMHFNDLLIQLRTRSLAGIATISSVIGILIQTHTHEQIIWEISAGLFLLLIVFWIAIWILDFQYYNRLLEGAAAAVVELEQLSEKQLFLDKLTLSSKISESVLGHKPLDKLITPQAHKPCRISAKCWFYLIVLAGLLAGCLSCFFQVFAKSPTNCSSLAVCKITSS